MIKLIMMILYLQV